VILLDFDGTITKTDIYPDMAPPKKGIREFLYKCKKYGIIIFIWAARCNNSILSKTKYPVHGTDAMCGISRYMQYYDLPYTDIAIFNKPIGAHFAKYIIDDRSRPDHSFFKFGD
jgi:hypothetical protein